jgi:PAS domain S-box-containing protein
VEDFYEFQEDHQVYQDDLEKVYPRERSPLALALQGVGSTQTDMEIHRPDGKIIAVEVSGVPIFGSDGKLTYALTTFMDISERIKHQGNLKAYPSATSSLDSLTVAVL